MLLICSNGGAVPDGGRNWPLRGCKWTNWEGGVRQTAVWSGGALPAASIGSKYSGIAHVADIYATLATFAGVSATELAAASASGPVPLDSLSLWEVLQNPRLPSPRTEVLIYGQNWSPDASTEPDQSLRSSSCKSNGKPSGNAYHNPISMRQIPAPNRSASAADECAAACCAETNCTGWMLTTPKLLRPPCGVGEPCCWLVDGGTLSKSTDPQSYSGSSGRPPPPAPQKPAAAGAIRSGEFKLIIGTNKFADWYAAPEDDNETAFALARSFCKLDNETKFPPTHAPNCQPPGCLFNLFTDPCGEYLGLAACLLALHVVGRFSEAASLRGWIAETRNLAAELPSKLVELTARLKNLSANPVPYDSCLPGCTAQKGCSVAKEKYSNFFGPYYPPVPARYPPVPLMP